MPERNKKTRTPNKNKDKERNNSTGGKKKPATDRTKRKRGNRAIRLHSTQKDQPHMERQEHISGIQRVVRRNKRRRGGGMAQDNKERRGGTVETVSRLHGLAGLHRRKERKKGKEKIKVSYLRQKDIFDPAKDDTPMITIAGLGNSGSQTAMALARLGFKLFRLFDHDMIEEHNLSSQYYSVKDVGKNKADALVQHMYEVNPDIIPLSYPQKYTPSKHATRGIFICAVDTMDERKHFCNELKKRKEQPELIVDGRMGGGQIELYTVNTVQAWEDTFFDTVSDDPCGSRFICYVSMIMGALIANQVKRYIKKEEYKKNVLFHIDTLQLITK